jgi:protein-S-isoprenylcysteine O-methyltransferase Ste14
MPFPVQLALLLGFIVVFTYFAFAGGQVFEYDEADEVPALVGQSTFVISGAMGAFVLGRNATIHPVNGVLAAALMLAGLALYEWARRTIRGRNFHLAWTGEVPDALCEDGPYARIRHPLYTSYMLVFFALFVAVPGWPTGAIFLFNLALFLHAALGDERSLARSELAAEYAAYKRRTGMFVPRLAPR